MPKVTLFINIELIRLFRLKLSEIYENSKNKVGPVLQKDLRIFLYWGYIAYFVL